jgi:hypothetical protein
MVEKTEENEEMEGDAEENKNFLSYYVMPKYGKNLEYIFN